MKYVFRVVLAIFVVIGTFVTAWRFSRGEWGAAFVDLILTLIIIVGLSLEQIRRSRRVD